jgi:hypothetical protein
VAAHHRSRLGLLTSLVLNGTPFGLVALVIVLTGWSA